jgi:Mor family transcriptional regulator
MSGNKNSGNELLTIVREELEQGAPMVGINGRAARDLARAVCERIILRAGGKQCYIPLEDRSRLRAEALADFTGDNHDEVCSRYRISRKTLLRWCSKK